MEDQLFSSILVAIAKEDEQCIALEQAIQIAKKENAVLHGLHVVQSPTETYHPTTHKIIKEFNHRCHQAGIQGEIAVEVGTAARQICERAQWVDLVLGKLTHPPADQLLSRLSSGFRIMVRRCSRPIWAVTGFPSPLTRILLAYNGSPKADEALFIATYMADKWELPVVVLTVDHADLEGAKVLGRAQEYFGDCRTEVEYLLDTGSVVQKILDTTLKRNCDLILIGGYGASPVVEVVQGSLVDQILRETTTPTLICR
jgi:nucleotide-binding universal stress UspA family protein